MPIIFRQILLVLILISFALGQVNEREGIDSTAVRSPGRALLFSTVPGGGQLYNQRPLKALLFAGVFSYFAYEYYQTNQDYQADQANEALHRIRNDKVWLMGLTWTLNILDAYVEAQLWDFEEYGIDEGELPETEIKKPKETEIINDTE